jgi:hypothetical protein
MDLPVSWINIYILGNVRAARHADDVQVTDG